MIKQRQVVEIPFNLSQGTENHPGIIISTNSAIEEEEAFMAMMLTSQPYNDEFSFYVSNNMFNKQFSKKNMQARLHLVSYFKINDVLENSHQNVFMTKLSFENLIGQFYKFVMNDF